MEIWKDIKGYEGIYQISNKGRVKSLERNVSNNTGFRMIKEKILKSQITKNGYVVVKLCNKTSNIHKLVLQTFNPTNLKLDTMHIDNDRTNNNLSNLKWGTRKENIQQMVSEGRNKGFHTGSGIQKHLMS